MVQDENNRVMEWNQKDAESKASDTPLVAKLMELATRYAHSYAYGFDPMRDPFSAEQFMAEAETQINIAFPPSRSPSGEFAPDCIESGMVVPIEMYRRDTCSLRDQFAMAILPSFVSRMLPTTTFSTAANDIYSMADAMMEARKPKAGRE